MKWDVLILIGVLILALVIFLVIQNIQDKKDLENTIEDDFSNPKHEHTNIE
jgi:large-conductance mechanosensitive channel